MQITTTLSQKGQIVLPKEIRESLGLKPTDRFEVDIKDEKVILSPISKTDEVFGMFKANKIVSKQDIKNIYKKAIEKKYLE